MYSAILTIVILVSAAIVWFDFSNRTLSLIFSILGLLFIVVNIWAPLGGVLILILMTIMISLYYGILAHIDETFEEFTATLKKVFVDDKERDS